MSDLETDWESEISDSSDDELMLLLSQHRVKSTNYIELAVQNYDEQTFFENFRISRSALNDIVNKYECSNFYRKEFGFHGKLSATGQVLITLWYLGHEFVSFRDVAKSFKVTISSVYRVLRRVIFALSNLVPEVIRWPTAAEKIEIAQHFQQEGFPGVIGCIDSCHIKIDKPSDDSDSYVNSKGYYSVQMQMVCDHQMKIRDVFVGYPGSVLNSWVFKNSTLFQNLEEKCDTFFLLADSRYPLKTNVLTPFRNRGQLTSRQINYNNKLCKNRYVVERCIEILKQKFRRLRHLKVRDIEFSIHLIRATCVLHNITLNDGFDIQENIANVLSENVTAVFEDKEEDFTVDQNVLQIRDSIVAALPM